MEGRGLGSMLPGGENPYFSAGFGLVALGGGLALARGGLKRGGDLLRRHVVLRMEVPSHDPAYGWVLKWVGAHAGHTQEVSVHTSYRLAADGRKGTHFELLPSPGWHWLTWKGRPILCNRVREKQMLDTASGVATETVTLSALGRDKQFFMDLLQHAKQLALAADHAKTPVYTAFGHEWRMFGAPRRPRPLHSVILDEGQSHRILHDVQDFLNHPTYYIDRGIPYRRGYLLYGPPGTGKTSFITALAGELRYGICVLNLSDKGLTDDRLAHLLSVVPERCITLLEDVDAALDHVGIGTGGTQGMSRHGLGVTLSGLLNTLDGVASTEERVLFMTTNHIERLHPALIRPGRIDVKEHIGHATAYQAQNMFLRFFPDTTPDTARKFAEQLATHTQQPVSMAQLQAYLMLHKSQPLNALHSLPAASL